MKEDLQLKLQAYLDGELSSGEAQAMTELLAQDAAARDLLVELTNTRAALLSHESEIKVPDSREFYWSKIRRQIEREEQASPVTRSISIMERVRRLLVPAGAVAAAMLGLLIVQQQLGQGGYAAMEADGVHEDSEAFTYRDYESGTTLVWLSYPAENEFADTDTEDTLELN
jgi:anti-sigma factor RsiW